jgi:hypothetical protein
MNWLADGTNPKSKIQNLPDGLDYERKTETKMRAKRQKRAARFRSFKTRVASRLLDAAQHGSL